MIQDAHRQVGLAFQSVGQGAQHPPERVRQDELAEVLLVYSDTVS